MATQLGTIANLIATAEQEPTPLNPFDSERKRMSIRRADGVLYVKGAIEIILARGLRVLAVAVGTTDEETDLTLGIGLVPVTLIELSKLLRKTAQLSRGTQPRAQDLRASK